MSMRLLGSVLAAGLLLAACGTGEAAQVTRAPATPEPGEAAPDPVPPEHLDAIAAYWAGREAAFAGGPDAGVAYIVERLHPDLAYGVADCRTAWFGDEPLEGFVERNAVDLDSVESMVDWVMTIGAHEVAPGPGVYRMEVELVYDGVPGWWPDRRVAAFLQVGAGAVRNFVRCETPQVSTAALDPPPSTTAAAAPLAPAETLVRTVSVRSLMADDGEVRAASTPECPNPRIEIRGDTAFIFCPIPPPGAPPPPPGEPAEPEDPPEPSGSRPPGTGLDFCRGDGEGREQAGDYYACGSDERARESGG